MLRGCADAPEVHSRVGRRWRSESRTVMATEDGRSSTKAMATDVLIVGGYGNVGQRIARLVADELGDQLLIGGRHIRHATRLAAALGSGAKARHIDIDDPVSYASALEGIGVVIMCLDTTELAFSHACVSHGTRYIDISASFEVIERLGFLHDLACAHRATIISSVGLAPGLTNLLAKACVDSTDTFVSSIDVHLLFGLGDRHGKAACEWLVDRLHRPFEVMSGGAMHEVWPFEEQSRAQFPAPFGERPTYRFDFSDQHTLPQTLGVPRVSTWATCNSASLARILCRLARHGVLRWTRYRAVRRLAVLLLGSLRTGSDRFALVVDAVTQSGDSRVSFATAIGTEEAQATAVIAAETLRRVLINPPAFGVFQLDELYDLTEFEETLANNGIGIDAPRPVTNRNRDQADQCHAFAALKPNAKGADQ